MAKGKAVEQAKPPEARNSIGVEDWTVQRNVSREVRNSNAEVAATAAVVVARVYVYAEHRGGRCDRERVNKRG